MKLYSYWRSSSAWRVRIALALKGIQYEYHAVHLLADGGEQNKPFYRAKNPMQQVPLLEFEQNGKLVRIGQSVAILEYLEDSYPDPPLLPDDLFLRARARELAEIVNSGIQPLQNTSVLEEIEHRFADADRISWSAHFISKGLSALEQLARETAGSYLLGDSPTIADVCLVPQLYNARRYGVDLLDFDSLLRAEATCEKLDAFRAAHPDRQPDAPER
jgi:maleylpyruvate isomerase